MVGNLEHIRPVSYKFPTLESIVASPFGTSETKTINAVSINLEELGVESGSSIILCDSPGFGRFRWYYRCADELKYSLLRIP